MNDRLFETALGIAEPWHVTSVDLDATAKTLTVGIDLLLVAGSLWLVRLASIRCTIRSASVIGASIYSSAGATWRSAYPA